jgi:hypothetical protein
VRKVRGLGQRLLDQGVYLLRCEHLGCHGSRGRLWEPEPVERPKSGQADLLRVQRVRARPGQVVGHWIAVVRALRDELEVERAVASHVGREIHDRDGAPGDVSKALPPRVDTPLLFPAAPGGHIGL